MAQVAFASTTARVQWGHVAHYCPLARLNEDASESRTRTSNQSLTCHLHCRDDDAVATEEKIWDLTQAINVKGVWWGCKYAVLAMRQNKVDAEKGLGLGGSVINVASFVAKLGAATPQLAYTASKGAVLAMTRELAMIHAREGIRFNSLCP